jgi:hypothetical protein
VVDKGDPSHRVRLSTYLFLLRCAKTSSRAFLNPYDLLRDRLFEAAAIFGHTPRVCFYAALGPSCQKVVIDQYRGAILEYANNPLPLGQIESPTAYRVFEISPDKEHRLHPRCVRPASDTVLWNLLDNLQDVKGVSLSKMFKDTYETPIGGPVADSMFRGCFHRHIGRQTRGRCYRLNPTDRWFRTGWLMGGFTTELFERDNDFTPRLARAVRAKEPIYLYSHSRIFPTVDAIAYEPGKPLSIFNIAAMKHNPPESLSPGSLKDYVIFDGASLSRILDLIQSYVLDLHQEQASENNEELEDLCKRPLDIIAVVPKRKKRPRFEWLRRRQTVGVTVCYRRGAEYVKWPRKTRSYELEVDPKEILDMRLKAPQPDVFQGSVGNTPNP